MEKNEKEILMMTFGEFCELYERDKGPRLKKSTWAFKRTIIETKLIPYFGKMRLSEIDPQAIMKWQNVMISSRDPKGKAYSPDYLRDLHAQLSAIFNHAIRYYDLGRNPASVVGTFNKGAPREIRYWTKEEYFKFARQMRRDPVYFCAFEILYWTGMREGELLALTPADFDFEDKTVTITKTYHRINGEDVITTPKTTKSNRTITLPVFLCKEIERYMHKLKRKYDLEKLAAPAGADNEEAGSSNEQKHHSISSNELRHHSISSNEQEKYSSSWDSTRLFTMSSYHLRAALNKGADRAGVKRIRVHDLRHSHVSLLINNGFSALAIGERVGHEAEKITYRYAHLFTSVQTEMADLLDAVHAR